MFDFRSSNCVVVGTFNIHIIQPHWLAEVGIFPKGAKVKFQTDLRSPGTKFSLGGDADESEGLLWHVRPDRLTVQSGDFDADCGTPIANVLRELNWTPVNAVGCNVLFGGSLSDLANPSELLPDITGADEYTRKQRSWHNSFEREGVIFNVQLSESDDQVELSLNAHTEINRPSLIQDSNQAARDSCAAFLGQRNDIINLAQSLLNVEIQK